MDEGISGKLISGIGGSFRRNTHKIALRVKDLSFQEKAALIVEDTKMRIWEELEDYEKLPPKFQEKFDEGLRELFADSFSSLGDEALLYAKTNSLPSRCDENVLPIARAFLRKLAQRHRPARDWIFANLQTSPQTDFFLAVKNLQDLDFKEKRILKDAANNLSIEFSDDDDFEVSFNKYLQYGSKKYQYSLKNNWGIETINMIKNIVRIEKDEKILKRIIYLLEYFKTKHRSGIVEILVENWGTLSSIDYRFVVHLLTHYSIDSQILRKKVENILIQDFGDGQKEKIARKGIEKVLK